MRRRTWLQTSGAVAASLLFAGARTGWAGSFDDFFQALRTDNLAVVQTLARRGFDLNAQDERLSPPLVLALQADALQVARFLAQQPAVQLDAHNQQRENALMIAAVRGHADVLRLLLERGAQPNQPGWTALHYAAANPGEQSEAMVALLLEHHAYIDAESPNGTTPLMMAARYGSNASLARLLDEGADPSLRNRLGLNAVDFARAAGRTGDVERIAAAIRAKAPKGAW